MKKQGERIQVHITSYVDFLKKCNTDVIESCTGDEILKVNSFIENNFNDP